MTLQDTLLDNETRYRLLRLLAEDPALSQRALAEELGISVGKVNYCLKALLDKGYIKVRNFNQSNSKHKYLYALTPQGLSAKAAATKRFLARKQAEYKRLKLEIEELRKEAAASK